MSSFIRGIVECPQLELDPIPFYKHPYKLFALTPITFLFWRTVELLGRESDDGLGAMRALGCFLPFAHNLGCLTLSEAHDLHSPALKIAVILNHSIQMISFFDAMTSDKLEDNALPIRVAVAALTVLASLGLIYYANQDKPVRRTMRIEKVD